MDNIALIITIYNRPEYLKKCFDSILKADLPENLSIYLVDDNSSDPKVKELWEDFSIKLPEHIAITYWKNEGQMGIAKSLLSAIEGVFNLNHNYVINLDGDAIVKPNFITRLIELKKKHKENIISGFHMETPRNPVVNVFDDHYTKRCGNGINLCFDKPLYEKFIKMGLQSPGNWDYNTSVNCQRGRASFIVSKPSVVQHIGHISSMGHHHFGPSDYAQDFQQLELPMVTLFGINAANPEGLLRAAEISRRDIKFGAEKIITERLFPGDTREQGRENFSRFMIKDLTNQIQTEHVLVIDVDGYVINWEAWDDDFLQYDYIGAPWLFHKEHMVGNGGFSLRSKKLLQILANDETINEYHPEDHMICRKYRKYLETKYGIKFAPVEVAMRFSFEGWGLTEEYKQYGGSFGFHGYGVRFGEDVPRYLHLNTPSPNGIPQDDPTKFPNFLPERFRPKTKNR